MNEADVAVQGGPAAELSSTERTGVGDVGMGGCVVPPKCVPSSKQLATVIASERRRFRGFEAGGGAVYGAHVAEKVAPSRERLATRRALA